MSRVYLSIDGKPLIDVPENDTVEMNEACEGWKALARYKITDAQTEAGPVQFEKGDRLEIDDRTFECVDPDESEFQEVFDHERN